MRCAKASVEHGYPDVGGPTRLIPGSRNVYPRKVPLEWARRFCRCAPIISPNPVSIVDGHRVLVVWHAQHFVRGDPDHPVDRAEIGWIGGADHEHTGRAQIGRHLVPTAFHFGSARLSWRAVDHDIIAIGAGVGRDVRGGRSSHGRR